MTNIWQPLLGSQLCMMVMPMVRRQETLALVIMLTKDSRRNTFVSPTPLFQCIILTENIILLT